MHVELFINAHKSNIIGGIISQMYKNLNNLQPHSTKYRKDRWGKENKATITKNSLVFVHFSGKAQNLMQRKNIIRCDYRGLQDGKGNFLSNPRTKNVQITLVT